jgi:hypothetical protein
MNKKGQAVNLGSAPALVLLIVTAVLITAAGALAVDSFKQTQCNNAGYTYSSGECNNGTVGFLRGDYAVNSSSEGLEGLGNLSSQFETIGTVLGVALIVAVVIGAFAFFINGRSGAL